jgi:hypothetical protein
VVTLPLLEPLLLAEELAERRAVHVLEDEVRVRRLVDDDVLEEDDRLVLEVLHELGLAEDARHVRRVVRDLDRAELPKAVPPDP